MCLIMIRCPRSGQEVWTGVETDPDTFQTIPHHLFYASCQHCGLEHAWWRDEAWLVDAPEQPNLAVNRDDRSRKGQELSGTG